MSNCQCNKAGYCSLMKRNMSEIRFGQCKNEPGYYEVFLKDSEKRNGISIATTPKKEIGPGTELKKLLKTIGITASEDCSCNANAKKMDDNGPDWCEDNIEQIVDWMEKEAGRRKLPFLRVIGRKLVRIAIKRARKAK